MKYSHYPGCTFNSTAVEYGLSTEAVCEAEKELRPLMNVSALRGVALQKLDSALYEYDARKDS